jgi:hypothetical protein
MKTLIDIKRRIRPGARIECVENTYRPALNGTIRIVVHKQGNAWTWRFADNPLGAVSERQWSHFPPAKGIVYLNADTVRLPLANPYGKVHDGHTLTLRFLDPEAAI